MTFGGDAIDVVAGFGEGGGRVLGEGGEDQRGGEREGKGGGFGVLVWDGWR